MVEELLIRRALRTAGLLACAIGASTAVAPRARADAVVTLCQQDTQAGAGVNLQTALAAGGTITFSCGAQASIAITTTHTLVRSVRVDGGGADRIVLDGGGRALSMFRVGAPNIALTLAGLTMRRALSPPGGPLANYVRGSVIDTSSYPNSSVELQAVEIRECDSPVAVRGAVQSPARLVVRNTRFANNTGIAIMTSGLVDLFQSSFIGNDTAMSVGGRAAGVSHLARVHDNVTFASHLRSAILVFVGGLLEVEDATFVTNRGTSGGAVSISGRAVRVDLRKVTFDRNSATAGGGAVSVNRFVPAGPANPQAGPVAVKVTYATFTKNTAMLGGAVAADLGDGGSLAVSAARFVENEAAEEGGAVFARPGGSLLIATSIVKANEAPLGSGFMLVRLGPDRSVVANSLLFANQATTASGGALVANAVELLNVTVAGNQGGGLGDGFGSRNLRDFLTGPPKATLRNVLLDGNAPANCVGAPQLTVGPVNLQSPGAALCPGVGLVADPLLDPFFAPLPGSPALGRGEIDVCLKAPVDGRDMLFQKRGVGGVCSIGAFEMAPVRIADRIVRRRRPTDQQQRKD